MPTSKTQLTINHEEQKLMLVRVLLETKMLLKSRIDVVNVRNSEEESIENSKGTQKVC